MDESATGSSVAVCKGMDCLEVGVGDGDACKRRDVGASREGEEVSESRFQPIVSGRDKQCVDGCVVGAADPDRLRAEVAGDVRINVLEECAMDGEQGVKIEWAVNRGRLAHGVGVGDDGGGDASGSSEVLFLDDLAG